MTPAPSATTAAPLPPLNLPGAPGEGDSPSSASPLASLMSGIAPIKAAVDAIQKACQMVVQSKAIPGSEQVCGQIIALAQSLLPMAAQNLLQPGMGGPGAGGGPVSPMPPSPGGPQPIMGGGQ